MGVCRAVQSSSETSIRFAHAFELISPRQVVPFLPGRKLSWDVMKSGHEAYLRRGAACKCSGTFIRVTLQGTLKNSLHNAADMGNKFSLRYTQNV
jgi:hypothetical protein